LLYVLTGEDDFSIGQSLEEIKRGVGDQTVLAANTTIFDGQVTLDQLKSAGETVPFLAEKRLVIVEGLLGRFESKSRPNRKKARLTDQPSDYQAIAACVSQIPDFTILVLVDGKIGSRNPLLRALSSAKAEVKAFPLLKGDRLRQWAGRRVKEAGGTASPQAVDLLARFVGGNLWIMANEIDKLVLYAAGRRIEEEDVRAVVSYAQEASVFAMVDAILEFRVGAAERLLEQLMQQGAAPAYLLVMLSRQARILVQVKELIGQGKSKAEIQEKLGLTLDFVLNKALEQAGKYSLARLKELYHQLLEADLSIKTGKYDGELALNILIAELGKQGIISTK